MRLTLTLERGGAPSEDLAVSLEPTVTIDTLAGVLLRRDPLRTSDGSAHGPVTLEVVAGGSSVVLSPEATVHEAGLRSGSVIRVVGADGHGRVAGGVATLRVLSGPDAGREFALPEGTSYIGRDRSCDVCLNDPLVSKHHAKIHIGDSVELVDTNSANGIIVDDEPVPRAMLGPDDVAVLGDTAVSVTITEHGRSSDAPASMNIQFNRAPRIEPYFEGSTITAPDVPVPAQSRRLQVVPLVIPIVMGCVLYLITRQATSLAFVALSPLMMVGNFTEGRITAKRGLGKDLAAYDLELDELAGQLAAAAVTEHEVRLSEHPATTEVIDAISGLTSLVWSRRPGERHFLEARFGTGIARSRTTIDLDGAASTNVLGGGKLAGLLSRFVAVDDVPIVAQVSDGRAVGVVGADDAATGLARSLVIQLAGLHSPGELVLAAVASSASAATWDFMKWLPHCSYPGSPLEVDHLAIGRAASLNLVAAIEELVTNRAATRSGGSRPAEASEAAVLLVVEDDAQIERSRLVALAEEGGRSNVHVLWHSPTLGRLPAACRSYAEVDAVSGFVEVVFVPERERVRLERYEHVGPAVAERAARRLAPVMDAGAGVDDTSDLPLACSFVSLVGPEIAATPEAVVERWRESNSISDRSGESPRRRATANSLRAVLGQSATDTFYVDLRAHGPHALVGGTTGAGKSELLQSWILGMAAAHSPDRVTFLLVDYKGGSAFGECNSLPHTVGMVTDLSLHLARRALTSLVAELRYRERILGQRRAKDLIELERSGDPDAPPSLVIVIDEFAALVQELPEFVDGVVNVAQRGRSLGLHLILATQRPAGVIKDNLRANTNLRLALRMADAADSSDVLGTPIAAGFDPERPGRAAAKLGPGRLVMFQTAYVGGWTSDTPPPPDIKIEELRFGGGPRWEEPESDAPEVAVEHGPNDIRRLVTTIGQAAKVAGIAAPRKPWLEELATIYDVAKLETARLDSELVFGVRDEPSEQRQPVTSFLLDQMGNMAVYGSGGSGKSTLLRTLAVAAGYAIRGGPCHVYGIDCGARGLQMLENLPHVGAVIDGEDNERIGRLFRYVRGVIDDRTLRFSQVRAGSLTEYRQMSGGVDEPRILILLDGIGTFRQNFEATDTKFVEQLQSIATEGRSVGVHLVATADRAASMSNAMASTMQQRLVLRMTAEADIAALGVPRDLFDGEVPPGRGWMDKCELQVAVFGGSTNLSEQAAAIAALASSMIRAGIASAPPIERLAEIIRLSDLTADPAEAVVVGVSEDTLLPVSIEPTGTFLVAGPPGSGRTTTIETIAASFRRSCPAAELFYVGNARSQLRSLDLWSKAAAGPEEVASLAGEIAALIESDEMTRVAVFVEAVADFQGTPADAPLQALTRACVNGGHFVVAEGETSTVSGGMAVLQLMKVSRAGFVLQPEQVDGMSLYKTPFGRMRRADFPVGRGILVAGGKSEKVQIALPA